MNRAQKRKLKKPLKDNPRCKECNDTGMQKYGSSAEMGVCVDCPALDVEEAHG